MPPLLSLPCVHEGAERLDWDRGIDLAVRRRWHGCDHPDHPLGPVVTGAMGCGPSCPGYHADARHEVALLGVAPLSVKELTGLGGLAGHPHVAFNGSLCRFDGRLYLAYRLGTECRLAWLDHRYQPIIDKPLSLLHERACLRQEDPRLFVFRGRLHVSFTGVERDSDSPTGLKTSVLYARLTPDQPRPVDDVYYPHYAARNLWEKNWSFFEHEGALYAVYRIKPHEILRVEHDHATLAYETETPHAWTGGHLRGGAPPVLVGGRYYHFFHGRVGLGVDAVYNTGLYTFEAAPPFRVLEMTRYPIQWAEPQTRTRQSASVVFVGGAMLDGDRWVLSYGEHDERVMVADFDGQGVEDRLVGSDYRLPPVWCIHCDELPERRREAEKEFNKANVVPKWWRGYHGNSWGLISQRNYTQGECPITPGHAALTLGHYALWQHLWETGAEEAVICEDDVALGEDFALRASDVLRSLPADAQFCYLGHTGCSQGKIKEQLCSVVARTDVVYGTHCYWLKRSALPVLLARMVGLKSHVDIQLWEEVLRDGHLRWYTATPEVATQKSAVGLLPGSLGGSPWAGIPENVRRLCELTDRHLGGWCPAEKARMMAGLVLSVKPRVVVEIGVYGGKSLVPQALAMRHLVTQAGHRGLVYGIDPWTYDACDEGWEGATGHKADHREWWAKRSDLDAQLHRLAEFISSLGLWPYVRLVGLGSERVADAFTHQPIDVLHVDGNHAEETSVRDVRLYLPRVRPGGWVWLDDVCWETTQAAVREASATCRLVLDCGNWRLYRKV